MRRQLQSADFRNICFPCPNLSMSMHTIEEKDWNSESPCGSKRSSATSTSSASSTFKMEQTSPNGTVTERRMSLDIAPVESDVLNVGVRAQLRRRNSSISRGRSIRNTISVPHCPIEEWSETFVAQDGVLTTNFCSTELWLSGGTADEHWARFVPEDSLKEDKGTGRKTSNSWRICRQYRTAQPKNGARWCLNRQFLLHGIMTRETLELDLFRRFLWKRTKERANMINMIMRIARSCYSRITIPGQTDLTAVLQYLSHSSDNLITYTEWISQKNNNRLKLNLWTDNFAKQTADNEPTRKSDAVYKVTFVYLFILCST